jgi:hypothetical protein
MKMERKQVKANDEIKILENNIKLLEDDLKKVTYCGSIFAIQREIEKVNNVINKIKERKK